MSVRGLGDAYAFQRLLWLLVGTVVVPTVLLALYGVWAISNYRAVAEEQVRNQQQQRMRSVAVHVFEEVDHITARVKLNAIASCPRDGEPCELGIDGVSGAWVWPHRGPLPGDLVGSGLPNEASESNVWYTPSDATDPIGLFRVRDSNVAWRLDTEWLSSRVADMSPGPGEVALEAQRAGPTTTFEEMMEEWQRPWFADLPLERPLAQFHLIVTFGETDPVGPALTRASTIYVGGLVLLVATVLSGTVITLRSANREIQLSRLQTDFVSSVSHELRTPLTAIRMFVETLQSGRLDEDPERVAECLDLLSQETDRLSRMIERVLGYARMEAGRRIYELEPVTARELVNEALRALESQRLLSEDNVDISVELPEGLPALRVDRDAIVEALLNLLQNAVRYTPAPKQIRVIGVEKGRRVGLSVEDNGPGIPSRDRKRIFEKFYQADTLLSRSNQEGSGLGLSIVRAVVRGHGGRVELDTEIGRGSRFTLWLPSEG